MALVVVAAVAAALGNWYSRLRPNDRIEFVTKPAVTSLVALTVALATGVPATTRVGFVSAFALCLLGDVVLMLSDGLSIVGLGAFLLGHIVFIVMLARQPSQPPGIGVGIAALVLMSVLVARPLLSHVRGLHRAMFIPVVAYFVVISVMVLIATWRGGAWATVGALAFYVSDALLAWDAFVRKTRFAHVAIMVTYHLALAGLGVAVVRSA